MNIQIEKRKHGVYRLRWQNEEGKRCSRTIHGNKKHAEEEKQNMLKRASGALFIPDGPPTIETLTHMLSEVKYELIADSTKRNTSRALKKCQDLVGNRLDLIRPSDIRYAMAQMKKKGLANTTINQWIADCRAAFKDGIMYGLIDNNPFTNVMKLKRIHKPIRVISEDEEAILFKSVLRAKDKCIMALALYGGLRAKEIARLNIRTDIDGNDIIIRSIEHDPTKSGKSRIVTIPGKYLQILNKYCTARLKRHTAHPFYGTGGGVSRRFYNIKTRAGIKCTLHDLRRTCASRLANDIGLQPWHLMDYMGHSDIKTTQKYYRAFSNQSYSNVWDKL